MTFEPLISHEANVSSANSLLVITVLIIMLFGWRLWSFTIIPMIWPDEPKLLPYWLPIIGHTVPFVRNPEKLIDYGYNYFGSNQPFALTVAGHKTVILRDVQDVAAVWRNTVDLSFDPFVQNVMMAFGISSLSVKKVFTDPRELVPEKSKTKSLLIKENPANKGYMNLEREWFKAQFLAPKQLHGLLDRYKGFLQKALSCERSETYVLSSVSTMDVKTISLQGFTRHIVTSCSISSFFGEKLWEIVPSFGNDYQDFEKESWKIFYRLPPIFARSSHAAKYRAMAGLEKYLSLPNEERFELAWIFQTMNQELQYLSVPPRDIAGIVMIIIWAINNNAHKIVFWMFSHIINDPIILTAVRAEIDASYCASGSIDIDVLLHSCPYLDAVWYETLRLYNAASVVREAKSPCIIGGKKIRVGDNIVAPFRQFHLQSSIFGGDPQVFRPERFLENKGLQRKKGYAPFGGGHTYCPGRLFAQSEIYLFIAETMRRYDLELEPRTPPQTVPTIDENMPSAAAIGPAHDLRVILRPRDHRF